MAGKGAVLASRILNEVAALGLVVGRVESAWKAAAANNDEFYYDSVALNIHSFYSGIERVFEKIASAVAKKSILFILTMPLPLYLTPV